MFKASINSTPFTTEAANDFFENINGESYGSDITFLATLRALVAPRIPADEKIRLLFGNSRYTAADIGERSVENAVKLICENVVYVDDFDNGTFYVHNLCNSSDNNMASMSVLEKKLPAVYPGYARLEAITAFFRKTFNVDCFINTEKKCVLVFVDSMDNRKMHYLQCAILAMLPWYFDKTVGVTEKEMELIQSMRETSPDRYNRVLLELSQLYDFKTARIKRMLKGFERRFEREEYDRTVNLIQNIDRQIENLDVQLGLKLRERNEQCIRLSGLDQRINGGEEEESEIMEYFLCNNKLSLDRVSGTEIRFVVKDYITYFDRDMAHCMIRNKNSLAYRKRRSVSVPDAEMLLTEIFDSDVPRLKIKTCAAYCINITGRDTGSTSTGISGYHFNAEFNDAIPNMHIQRHSCLGNYRSALNTLIQKRDYIGAIEQCIASCKSLNFADSIVMEEFFNSFYSGSDYNNRCIELPDGNVVNPEEAIRWLKEHKPAEEVTHEQEETTGEE